MSKILLLSLPYKKNYMRNARCDFVSWSGTNWWPILLGYLGAFLESKGHKVSLVDGQAYELDGKGIMNHVEVFSPDFICVYPGNESFEFDMKVAENLNKARPTKLIGPFYSLNADKYKVAGIEGGLEDGVLSWIEGKLDDKKPIVGEHLTTEQLDAVPYVSEFYSRHLEYKYYHTPSEPYPFVDILTGRGCFWGKCEFCLWPRTYKQGYTARSIDDVMSELDYIEKQTPFKSVMIEDDSLPAYRIEEFCEEKLRWNIRIPWSCLVRANIDHKTLKLMKKAGCLNLHVGYESGNNSTLERINKGITVSEMETFTYYAKRAGLRIHGDFITGLDDTEQQIKRTIAWACRLKPHTAQFQVYVPYFEKTALEKERLEQLARYAYRKFYLSAHGVGAIVRQFSKPKILQEAVYSVFFKKGE